MIIIIGSCGEDNEVYEGDIVSSKLCMASSLDLVFFSLATSESSTSITCTIQYTNVLMY